MPLHQAVTASSLNEHISTCEQAHYLYLHYVTSACLRVSLDPSCTRYIRH